MRSKAKPKFGGKRREHTDAFAHYIAGRRGAVETMVSGRARALYVQTPVRGDVKALVETARKAGIAVYETDAKTLQEMVPDVRQQGIVVELPPYEYATLESVLATVQNMENALVILLDGVEDPHNLGAIIRSADGAGAAAVIIPERRSAAVTEVVHKTSAGAVEWLPIVRVTNLVQTLTALKQAGFWVGGADMEGDLTYTKADWRGKIVIVLGNEGKGISRLVRENCDFMVQIPMWGKVSSLNVSVAGALMMFEAARQQRSQHA